MGVARPIARGMNRFSVGPWSTEMVFTDSASTSTRPLGRAGALATADWMSFAAGLAAPRLVERRMFGCRALGESQDVERRAHGLAADQVHHHRDLAGRHPEVPEVRSRFHVSSLRSAGPGAGGGLGDLLLRRVPAERPRGRELAELVTHHVLGDEDRDELPAVVHREGVPHELGKDGGPARPGLHHLLLVPLDEVLDLLQEVRVHEGALLDRTCHVLALSYWLR